MNDLSVWNSVICADIGALDSSSPEGALVQIVNEIYTEWAKGFKSSPTIAPDFEAPYFVGKSFLTPFSGLVQIAHQVRATNNTKIANLFEKKNEALRRVKSEIHEILLSPKKLDYFGKGAKAELPAFIPQTSFEHTVADRAALAAFIVNHLKGDKNLGRVKLAKCFYLVDSIARLNLKTKYVREAAGPLDQRAFYNNKYGLERIAQRLSYFESASADQINAGIRYTAGEKLMEGALRGQDLMGESLDEVRRVLQLFRRMDTEQTEIVVTLYACWNDLIRQRKTCSFKQIVDEMLFRWHPEKTAKFKGQQARLRSALEWMEKNQLVPNGKAKVCSGKE